MTAALSPRETRALHGSAILAERAETYRRLMVEALPFAEVELARLKAGGRYVSDEPGKLRQIQAALASTAMIRGHSIEQAVARLTYPAIARKRA